VYSHIQAHQTVGSFTLLGTVAHSPTTIPFFLPSVPAGFPSPAQDHLEARVYLDELMDFRRPQVELIEAHGNSLRGVGIFNRDILAIDKSLDPQSGDVIAALLNGEPVLQILGHEAGQLVLRSAPVVAPRFILDAEDFVVQGVYVGLARRSHAPNISLAQPGTFRSVSLDELLHFRQPQIFLIRVNGHSLSGLGILHSDILAIDKALQVKPGSVIVACINGEPLLKVFDLEDGRVVLRSANEKYSPRYILEGEEFSVWGVMVGLARRGRLGD
jgi:DNA polymerase V